MPVAAAAFLAARLSFDPVFRSTLFAIFLAFDNDPVFLRFAMGILPVTRFLPGQDGRRTGNVIDFLPRPLFGAAASLPP
jgi:hypothetical protein